MKARNVVFGLISLVIIVVVLGLTLVNEDDAAPAADELPTIRYVNFRVYDPVYIALDRGLFEQHGVYVDVIGDVLAGPTAIQAVASGSAEAGLSSLPAIINANAAGLPILGVSDIQSALPGQPLEYYYVRADSPLQSVSELAGTRFAVNLIRSSFHYTALLALEDAGVNSDDVEFVLLPFDRQLDALLGEDVDVIGLMEPYAGFARDTAGEDIRLLFDAIDVFGEKQFTTHFVNRVWARENPDAAAGFVAAIAEAAAWIEEHQDEARVIVADYTGIDEEYVPDYHFQPGAKVVESDVQWWLDTLIERGDVTVDWLTADQVANNQYHPDNQ